MHLTAEDSLVHMGVTQQEASQYLLPMPSDVEGEVDAQVEASEDGGKVMTTVDEKAECWHAK